MAGGDVSVFVLRHEVAVSGQMGENATEKLWDGDGGDRRTGAKHFATQQWMRNKNAFTESFAIITKNGKQNKRNPTRDQTEIEQKE